MAIGAAAGAGYAIAKYAAIVLGVYIFGMTYDDMVKAIERKTGKRYNQKEWESSALSDYSKMKTHENATKEWDKERDKFDRWAEENASGRLAAEWNKVMTQQKVEAERDYFQKLADENAERVPNNNLILDPTLKKHIASTEKWDIERQELQDRASSVAGWQNLLPNLETKPLETPSDSIPQEGVIDPPVIDGTISKPQDEVVVENPHVTDVVIDVPKEEVITPVIGDTTTAIPKEETQQPPTEEKKDEEDKIGVPTITDKTEENIEQAITYGWDMEQWIAYMENAQKKQWEREDKIRQEGYDREDSAYQRAVADMKKAGINPNLMNVQPADSGTGITNATGMDYAGLTKQMETTTNLLMKMIDREFQGDENTKKNFTSLISAIIQGMFMMGTFSK